MSEVPTRSAPATRERQDSPQTGCETTDTSTQCEAIADSTGERCQHDAIRPIPYCGDHKHLMDEVDLNRIGLNLPKSGG